MRALSVLIGVLGLGITFPAALRAGLCNNGDILTLTPVAPTAADPIVVRVDGSSGASLAWLDLYEHGIEGGTIRVDGLLDPGSFAVGSSYSDTHELGHLPPGTYMLEVWYQCTSGGSLFGDPYLALSAPLTVGVAPYAVPIPALAPLGLAALAAALAWAALLVLRRRA